MPKLQAIEFVEKPSVESSASGKSFASVEPFDSEEFYESIPSELTFDQITADFAALEVNNSLPTISFSHETTFSKVSNVFSTQMSLVNANIAALDTEIEPVGILVDDALDNIPEIISEDKLSLNGCIFCMDDSVTPNDIFYLDTSVLNIEFDKIIKSFTSIIVQLAPYVDAVSSRSV